MWKVDRDKYLNDFLVFELQTSSNESFAMQHFDLL